MDVRATTTAPCATPIAAAIATRAAASAAKSAHVSPTAKVSASKTGDAARPTVSSAAGPASVAAAAIPATGFARLLRPRGGQIHHDGLQEFHRGGTQCHVQPPPPRACDAELDGDRRGLQDGHAPGAQPLTGHAG